MARRAPELDAVSFQVCDRMAATVQHDGTVPRISEFYGIAITLYYAEHGVPHFHALYAGQDAAISIESLEVLAGALPARALRLIREWATLHRAELERNWNRARHSQPLQPIEPLA